eukprot:4311217-Prymnesium_polylepis.1
MTRSTDMRKPLACVSAGGSIRMSMQPSAWPESLAFSLKSTSPRISSYRKRKPFSARPPRSSIPYVSQRSSACHEREGRGRSGAVWNAVRFRMRCGTREVWNAARLVQAGRQGQGASAGRQDRARGVLAAHGVTRRHTARSGGGCTCTAARPTMFSGRVYDSVESFESSWPMRPTSTHERSSTVSNCAPEMGGGHGMRTAKWPEERCRSTVLRSSERADSSSSRPARRRSTMVRWAWVLTGHAECTRCVVQERTAARGAGGEWGGVASHARRVQAASRQLSSSLDASGTTNVRVAPPDAPSAGTA